MAILLRSTKPFGPFAKPVDWELPDFVVLTGDNGSGKTQLLSAIKSGAIVVSVDGVEIATQDIVYTTVLEPKLDLRFAYQQCLQIERNATPSLRRQSMMPQLHDEQGAKQLASQVLGKPTEEILEDEARAFALAASARTKPANLAQTSAAYVRRWYHQQRARIAVEMGQTELATLASLENGEEPTPPWQLVSEMLKPFGFSLVGPELTLRSAERDIVLELRDSSGQVVEPSHLSGGERCLLAIALEQYKAESGTFPKVLLLDESLAPLHPSVVRKALGAVKEVLAVKYGIRIILVTHSPTLVALTDEESLFCARKNGTELLLSRVSKDASIAQLTIAVPTLRFDAKNRRQVVVEADIDEFIFGHLYDALRERLRSDVWLQFLPGGARKDLGGCDAVKTLVERLRGNGISTVYGVLDWDGHREPDAENGIAVLAHSSRYAIENVMLDPVLLLLLLARREVDRKFSGGLTPRAIADLAHDDLPELQRLVDKIVGAIKGYLKLSNDGHLKTVQYIDGFSLNLPAWVLATRGKNYADAVLNAFPTLAKYQAGTNAEPRDKLMCAIAADVVPEWPGFVPMECKLVFDGILGMSSVASL